MNKFNDSLDPDDQEMSLISDSQKNESIQYNEQTHGISYTDQPQIESLVKKQRDRI